jgi:hypothetical protein
LPEALRADHKVALCEQEQHTSDGGNLALWSLECHESQDGGQEGEHPDPPDGRAGERQTNLFEYWRKECQHHYDYCKYK